MSEHDNSRLALELELLEAMYPGQVEYKTRSRDVKFTDGLAQLHLRLPELYPDSGLPDVILANDVSKKDLRNQTKDAIGAMGLADGEEVLDAIIACFQSIVETNNTEISRTDTNSRAAPATPESSKTVIIWLHHLLALTKRKLALGPIPTVSGITKPGYPGIMAFTGPSSAVTDHVNMLKAENWQAFQVRYEGAELWEFGHSAGVREVETMADVVKAIEAGTNGAKQKEEFLKAAGIK
ncbi:hypothetical protein BDV95DRAFT_503389 [Massariosphaeria phaeospora]|uniref:RWD domain-containing protein n=1 Tax=Massariosphaeria phaeospora TaxID=100035 RepID=A0A7C8M943_9PLEO|nr:hypothetical protein BDV95DRAFT_503389 [Massariosphaeria phaeospora]